MKTKNLILAMLISISGLSFLSCSSEEKKDQELNIDAVPVQFDKDGSWTMVNSEFNKIENATFENCPSMAVNGFFSVRTDTGIDLYRIMDGKAIKIENYSNLRAAGIMNEGLMPVAKHDSSIEIINEEGVPVFKLETVDGKIVESCDNAFRDGMLKFSTQDGGVGYVNTVGGAISSIYHNGTQFNDGRALVSIQDQEEVIDKKGNRVFLWKDEWKIAGSVSHKYYRDGVLPVINGNIWGFVNTKGKFKEIPQYGEITDIRYGYYVYDNGHEGVSSLKNNKSIIPAKYGKIDILPDDRFLCTYDFSSSRPRDCDLYHNSQLINEINGFRRVEYNPVLGLIAYDEDGFYSLLDEMGNEIDTNAFYNRGENLSLSYAVTSGYFDLSEIIGIMLKAAVSGFGKFTYGAQPSNLFPGNERSMSDYSNEEPIEDGRGEGYKFRYYTLAKFRYPCTQWSSDVRKIWTPNNYLLALNVNFDLEIALSKNSIEKILNAFEKIGYEVLLKEEIDNDWQIGLRNDKRTVLLFFNLSNPATSERTIIKEYVYDTLDFNVIKNNSF